MNNPSQVLVRAQNLSRNFNGVSAVEDLSFEIHAGEVFGLLGPNGAGKTTTIRMLSALISPSGGSVEVAGYRLGEHDTQIRANVGILTESPGMYESISAERNLAFFAGLYGVVNVKEQVARYLNLLGLWDRRKDAVGSFSKGMRQKLAIARALLHDPRVLYLDEPTSGLDPEAALLVRDFIVELRQSGRAIILCTHNLAEAERLCDRVAVLKKHILALDSPVNMRQQMQGRTVVFHLSQVTPQLAQVLQANPLVLGLQTQENKLVVQLKDPESANPLLVRELVAQGAEIQFIGEVRQSLEEVYLHLVRGENGAE